jgi:hypothetical protein
MDLLILVMAIKGKEMNKDVAMELDQSFGLTDQVMKASGIKVIVMVMEYIDKNLAKNIVVNGKMMFVTEKASGPKQMAQSFSETSEMICVMDYARCRIKGKEILY